MIKNKKIMKEVEIIDDIICNKCGKTCLLSDSGEFNGLLEVEIDGSYSSTHLEDLVKYKFSMCEKCLTELFKTFCIDPKIESMYKSFKLKRKII